jgi:PAS domain S-box-containing protein
MTVRDQPDESLAKRLARALGKEPRKVFAKRAGVTGPQLSRWLSGAREPGAAPLRKLVSALGISGHWLLTGEGMMYDVPRVAVRTIGRMEKLLEDFIKEAGSDDSAPGDVQEAVAGVIPWVADAQTWVFTWVGPQVVEMLGYAREDWYETDFWADHIHREDRKWVLEYCLECSQTSKQFVFEYRMVKKDGGTLWLRDFVSVDSLNGLPVTLKGIMFDISDIKENRKKAENRSKRSGPPHERIGDDLD